MAQPLNVLIVGCGAIAGDYDVGKPPGTPPLSHAGAYSRHGGFRLAACVDPDEGRRNAFSSQWNVGTAHADLAEVTGDIDVVSICSPTDLHAAHFDLALALRPRLIFCEKPITPTLADSERLVARCAEDGVLLAVNHTRRWAPDVVALRQQLAEARWGEVRSAYGIYNKGVLNNGSHMIDLLQFLLGPLRFVACGEPVYDFWPADPTVPAILATKAGLPISLAAAYAADFAQFELTLIAEQGTITMEDGGDRWRDRAKVDSIKFRGYRALDAGHWRDGRYDDAMFAAVSEIFQAITLGRQLSSTGKTALAAQRLCSEIRAAATDMTTVGTQA